MLVGCGSTPSPTAAKDRLIIGVMGDFSENPAFASGIWRGVDLAAHEYNENAASTYEVRVIKSGTKASAEGTSKATEELLATDLLTGVIGPLEPDEVRLAGPSLAGAQIPFLIPSATDQDLSANEWTSFRRLVADDRREGEALAKETILASDGGGSAIFHDGSEAGGAFADGVKVIYEQAHLPPLKVEGITSKKPDYAAIAAPVAKAPSAIFYGGATDRGAALLTALVAAGFKGRFVGSHSIRNAEFIKSVGPAGEGVLTACVCADASERNLAGWAKRYRERFGARPGAFGVESYEGAWMLLEAIEEVEPRPNTISRFFAEARIFQGETKRYEYDGVGELVNPPVWVYQLHSGKWDSVGRTRLLPK